MGPPCTASLPQPVSCVVIVGGPTNPLGCVQQIASRPMLMSCVVVSDASFPFPVMFAFVIMSLQVDRVPDAASVQGGSSYASTCMLAPQLGPLFRLVKTVSMHGATTGDRAIAYPLACWFVAHAGATTIPQTARQTRQITIMLSPNFFILSPW